MRSTTKLAIAAGSCGCCRDGRSRRACPGAGASAGYSTGSRRPGAKRRRAASKCHTGAGEALIKGAGRYSFTKVDDGLLRLDSVSGQITVCSQHAAGWACEAVPEERAALEKEIGRLQDEVAALKAEIAALREPEPAATAAGRSDAAPEKPAAKDAAKDSAQSILPSPERHRTRPRRRSRMPGSRLVDMFVGFKNDVMRKGYCHRDASRRRPGMTRKDDAVPPLSDHRNRAAT